VTISSDGSCAWSRPGQLSSLCGMQGLQNFPYDVLTCNLRFGGWSWNDKYQNLSLMAPPVSLISDDFDTFREYKLLKVISSSAVEEYDFGVADRVSRYPVVKFEFEFQRARAYYGNRIIIINVVMTYLACGVFYTDPLTGERLGFSMTMLLTLVASDIIVAGAPLASSSHFTRPAQGGHGAQHSSRLPSSQTCYPCAIPCYGSSGSRSARSSSA
jgi:hypothetical protein